MFLANLFPARGQTTSCVPCPRPPQLNMQLSMMQPGSTASPRFSATRCGPRSALWRLGPPGSKPRPVRCLLGFLDGHSSGQSRPRPQRRRPPVASPPGPSRRTHALSAGRQAVGGSHSGPDMRPHGPRGDEPTDCLRGWQRTAVHACDERALKRHLSDLTPVAFTGRATLRFGSCSFVGFGSPSRSAHVPVPVPRYTR